MNNARTCLTLVAALALAGTVSAQSFTEDFDGSLGTYGNGDLLTGGTNGWNSSGGAWRTTGATGGFLGTRGATYTGNSQQSGISLTTLGFSGPVTSGTFEVFVLMDTVGPAGAPGNPGRAPQFGLSDSGCCTRFLEVDGHGAGGGIRYRELGGTNFSHDTSIPTEAGRWMEYRLRYNRNTGVADLHYRDVNDTDGSIPLPAFIAHSATGGTVSLKDVDSFYLRGFFGGGAGTIDRISSTPLPEPTALGLMAIGGLMLLRRRRRA